jgi:prepilin-type N-terminal cleavage/methylation domain-containing protein/prepilin-type processing-associated H-X9-DG protein
MSRRRGFTLIELLVVVLILGVLAGLLVPAVQNARSAATRLQCLNHMKQIGIALHSYASLHRLFPGVNTRTQGLTPDNWASAHAFSPLSRMLPELEQSSLYHAINFNFIPWDGPGLVANQTVMLVGIETFLCPADAAPSVPGYGRSSYRFGLGPTPWEAPIDDRPGSYAGPFSVHRYYGPADFADGLSQTVGASERLQGDWYRSRNYLGNYVLDDVRMTVPDPGGADWALGVCRASPPDAPRESRAGESWFLSGFHFTLYNHCNTPNAGLMDCVFDDHNETVYERYIHEGVMTARSRHPGGVNALFMDGSVKFARDAVNLAVWRALSTRSGGEVVGSTSY